MEEAGVLTMERNASRGAKGFSLGEWKPKAMILPRKRLSDITNSSISGIEDGIVPFDLENGKTGSPVMISENMAKLLKENNALMRVITEMKAEMQNLRLMVAKQNQQNWQLAQAHSQMLAELNLGRDRIKAGQHELSCTSTALKVKTQDLELKTQELEELKKWIKENMRMQNITTLEGHINPVENVVDASLFTSHKRTCLPNRKHPQRSQSIGPMFITNEVTTEEENKRKPSRRKSNNLKAAPFVPTEDLFEIEDTELPILKDGGSCLHREPSKQEEDQVSSSLIKRTSLGRPLRRAAVKVSSYKELSLTTKLRRPE